MFLSTEIKKRLNNNIKREMRSAAFANICRISSRWKRKKKVIFLVQLTRYFLFQNDVWTDKLFAFNI